MADIITHQGIVEKVDGACIFVRIVQMSACASCSAKGFCSSADSKEKIIEVNSPGSLYKVGDGVWVMGQVSMGMKAVLLAFFIPFLILVVSLFIFMNVTDDNEWLSILLSVFLLASYYFVIGLKKEKLKKSFSFTIKPINSEL